MRRAVFVITLIINTLVAVVLNAQVKHGTVKGKVSEIGSSVGLVGVSVVVEGTNYGTITDFYGNYILTNIPSGKITLKYSYIGYDDKVLSVDVTEGGVSIQDVILKMSTVGLSEVVVSAQLIGQSKAINQQLNSDALVNVVSEDKIKELPDVNVAEAVGRLSGVAVKREAGEGQKVMIRGLSPSFSNVTINGIRVASNSSIDKSVNLSMISPDLLSGIEVMKSSTSDMAGDAVGGTINLVVKKAPDKQQLNLKLEGGYANLNKTFGNYSIIVGASKRFFNNKLGVIFNINDERVDRSNHLLGTDSKTENNKLYYEYFKLSNIDEIRKRTGANINIDYNLKQGNISLFAFYSNTNRDIFQQMENYSPKEFNGVKYTSQISNIYLDLFSTALRGEHHLNGFIIDWSLSSSITNNSTPLGSKMIFYDKDAYVNNSVNNNNFREWIDYAEKDYSESILEEAHSFVDNVNEKYRTALFNIKYPFGFDKFISGFVKAGAKYSQLDRYRDFNETLEPWYYQGGSYVSDAVGRYNNPINYTSNGLISTNSFFYNNTSVDNYILRNKYPLNVNFDRSLVQMWENSQADFYIKNRKKDVEDYSVEESVMAFYLMSKLKIGSKVTIISGLRFENTNNTYSGKYSALSGLYGEVGYVKDTATQRQYQDVLPNLHIIYKPLSWLYLRASATKTIARPNYNYVTPGSLIDSRYNTITAGAPDLKHMESWNYDFNSSLYTGKYGLFTVSLFYKDIKNIFYKIDNYYLASDSIAEAMGYKGLKNYYLTSYANSPKAKVWGVELDMQTSLKFLSFPFNGIVVGANLSRLFSETEKYWFTTKDTTYRDPVTGVIVTESEVLAKYRKIVIPGQVPYIFNMSVGYDLKGFSFRISGVFQDTYLELPGVQDIENEYFWNFWRWDISIKQHINKKISIFTNMININSQKEEIFKNKDVNSPVRIQDYGMAINFGVTVKL
jgi:TonB-dependent receptor